RFGWDGADRAPCQKREGEWWIGTGMATAARVHNLNEARARVRLCADGTAVVESDMTDIGTGTYTVLGQVAAEMLGLDPADVLVRLGDSDFPPGAGSGGSWGAPSTGSAVFEACEAIRARLAERHGCSETDLTLKDGLVTCANVQRTLAAVLQGEDIEETGHFE